MLPMLAVGGEAGANFVGSRLRHCVRPPLLARGAGGGEAAVDVSLICGARHTITLGLAGRIAAAFVKWSRFGGR